MSEIHGARPRVGGARRDAEDDSGLLQGPLLRLRGGVERGGRNDARRQSHSGLYDSRGPLLLLQGCIGEAHAGQKATGSGAHDDEAAKGGAGQADPDATCLRMADVEVRNFGESLLGWRGPHLHGPQVVSGAAEEPQNHHEGRVAHPNAPLQFEKQGRNLLRARFAPAQPRHREVDRATANRPSVPGRGASFDEPQGPANAGEKESRTHLADGRGEVPNSGRVRLLLCGLLFKGPIGVRPHRPTFGKLR